MGWGGSLPLLQFASAVLLHKKCIYKQFIISIYPLDTFKSCQKMSGFTSSINYPGMMSSIGKAPHLVSADCAMLLVGTSYHTSRRAHH